MSWKEWNRKNGRPRCSADERYSPLGEHVGKLLVDPERRFTAGHVADPADTVDDRVAVLAVGLDPQEIGVLMACRPVADLASVAHLDRIGPVETYHTAILEIDGRHSVAGCREQEAVVEADLERSGSNLSVPVDVAFTQPEVPLADDGRLVAGTLEHRSESWLARTDDRGCIARQDLGAAAKAMLAGEQRVPRRRAGRRGAVAVREEDALGREPTDVWRLDA